MQMEGKFRVRNCENFRFSGNSRKCSGPFVTANFRRNFSSNRKSLLLLETFTTSYFLIFILLFHFLVVSVTVSVTVQFLSSVGVNKVVVVVVVVHCRIN